EGIRKKRLGLRVKRIDWDGAVAEPLHEDRPLVHVQHHTWPKVDKQEPSHDHEKSQNKQMFVFRMRPHLTSTTGGTMYFPSRMAPPGTYTRSQSMNLAAGAGNQLDS